MKFSNLFFLLAFFCALISTSCKKEEVLKDSSAKLDFSTSAVVYDTVFSSIGSTTKVFKIYNKHSQKINISKLFLATGPASQFRISVDGVSAYSHSDVEILAKDSMFVFVQVTVNPTGANSPLLIRDSVIFETNGNIQDVKLTAIGQDVYLHKPNTFPINGLPPYSIIPCSLPWTSDKPHLIFGYAVVDSDSTLTMNPGTRVYMNTGAILWIFKDGTLNVKGEKGKEVTFQGARLDNDYKDIPGQWGKIWMMAGSKNNKIDWAIIKNGSIGVQVDSLGSSGVPTLKLTNTIIKNMAAAALYARNSHVRSNNCVFANCGQYLTAISTGGKYRFEHCTFANYWTQGQRTTPSIYLSNYNINGSVYTVSNLDSAYFGNCIVYGDKAEEIELDASTYGGTFSYKFENCILKTGKIVTDDGIHFNSVYSNLDPEFKDITGGNFQLKVISNAIDKGYTNSLSKDLNNENRPNSNTSIPDLGAFEYYQ